MYGWMDEMTQEWHRSGQFDLTKISDKGGANSVLFNTSKTQFNSFIYLLTKAFQTTLPFSSITLNSSSSLTINLLSLSFTNNSCEKIT